jgi:hypothetical protein
LEDAVDWYYSITSTNLQDENFALQTYFQVQIVWVPNHANGINSFVIYLDES